MEMMALHRPAIRWFSLSPFTPAPCASRHRARELFSAEVTAAPEHEAAPFRAQAAWTQGPALSVALLTETSEVFQVLGRPSSIFHEHASGHDGSRP